MLNIDYGTKVYKLLEVNEVKAGVLALINEAREPYNEQIAKAVNKALVLQFEMDLENLSMHNSIHELPKEYVVARKYGLERSIEILKEHKEEL